MFMKKQWSSAVLFCAPLLASCLGPSRDPVGSTCTTEARGIMVVEVSDSITGVPVQLGLDGKYEDPSFTGSFYVVENKLFSRTYERPGTYTVTIFASNYKPWVKNNVVVAMEPTGCHIIPVSLEAKLVKDS